MSVSDTELEAGLRALRSRADDLAPLHGDLAERTRARYRADRRSRGAWAAGGLAALIVLVGVPVASDVLLTGSHPETAAPVQESALHGSTRLDELPTRGSLAGDAEWLAEMAELPWGAAQEPPVESRVVAYAGDVPGARVALVLARGRSPVMAWFVGAIGASPGRMVPASPPTETTLQHPLALLDAADPASGRSTLVVVSWPGDDVTRVTGRSVEADGTSTEQREPFPTTDGAGAVTLDGPPAWPLDTQLWVEWDRGSYNPTLTVTQRALATARPLPDVADPRDLGPSVRDEDVRAAVEALSGYYGLPAEDLSPTLLAGAPITGDPRSSVVLVGATFPSGATAAAQVIVWADENGSGLRSQVALLETAPAGTALVDRVFVAPSSVPGTLLLTVSGPADAVLAEAYAPDGTLLMRLPLTDGSGTAASAGNPGDATVRLYDRSGSVLAETPLTGPVGE